MNGVEPKVIEAGDILVVDDTIENLRLLMDILTGAGYHARPAGNGELALRSAGARPPALVLLDIMMPDMDGFEVCRRLKADALTQEIPVIFLSGLTDTTDKAIGFSLGAVDYVTKPFHAEEVLARVRTHLALAAAKQQLRTQNLQLTHANEQITGEIAVRVRTEGALRESRDQLEGLYLSVGEGIVSIDAEQRIVLFNAAAERMFGHSAASVIGRPVSTLLPQRFRMPHKEHVRSFDASGQSNRAMGTYGLIHGLRASGEEFPVEATVSQSGIAPNKLFTVVLRDITERRQAEKAREQLMRQLESLSARLATAQEEERRRIAYALHEEVGQELIALKLYLQMLGHAGGGTTAEAPRNEALAVAVHATERVRKLVLDLVPPELADFGLHAAVHTYCEGQAAAGGWDLHLDAPKPEVRAPGAVERAGFRLLQEALGNVLRHASATEIWVEVQQGADELELSIRDNGIGFDPNAMREDNRHEGSRLGLFGMQIRVKQVGGSVAINSAAGQGTEVRAVFPLIATPS